MTRWTPHKAAHLALMAKMGHDSTDAARAFSATEGAVRAKCVRMGVAIKRPAAYEPEPEEIRLAVIEAGEEAARRGIDEAMCPYDADDVALRCHWMAGYYDAVKEMRT